MDCHPWLKQHTTIYVLLQNDPGGICYRRNHATEDMMFDTYHPWERVSRWTDRQVDSLTKRETDRQIYIQKIRQANGQVDSQTDRQSERPITRQKRTNKLTDKNK